MATVQPAMVNTEFEPPEDCETVLEILKDGREENEPWGYVTPGYLRDLTGMDKADSTTALRRLEDAGWISSPYRGLYRFVEDPRESEENEDR